MKILCSQDLYSNASAFILKGWKNVFEHLGHQFLVWDQQIPAFDIFYQYNPDIFIGTTYGLNRALIKCLNATKIKIVLKANNWGNFDQTINRDIYPICIADDKEKELVNQIRHLEPTLYNYYDISYLSTLMNGWINDGYNVLGISPAADIYTYHPGPVVKHLKSDIGFVGRYRDYKATNINKFLGPLCHPIGKYNLKIFGNKEWEYPQYCGFLPENEISPFYNSCSICLNIDKPHATDYGFEVNHRVFSIAASKSFCLSNYVQALDNIFFPNNELNMFKTFNELQMLLDKFLDNSDDRLDSINKCYEQTITNNTYHHRVKQLFEHWQMSGECEQIDLTLQRELTCHDQNQF